MALDFVNITDVLKRFAFAKATQDQEHIKPFHSYVAFRLVLEGGFLPDEMTPHPALQMKKRKNRYVLTFDEKAETTSELTIFGGMKTKQVDVVVAKAAIGPVVAVSVKGTFNAYRNLVNRMEEAVGDSTNIHIMYPGLVYGFLHLLRANRQKFGYGVQDIGITDKEEVSPAIKRYCAALSEMTGRRFVRNDYTRYESVGVVLVENDKENAGRIYDGFPSRESPLRLDRFFSRLYEVYDLRFPARAEHLAGVARVAWDENSPLFRRLADMYGKPVNEVLGYSPCFDAE